MGELDIYNGRVTSARIAREIHNGATVESVRKIDKSFDVDGEKVLAWLIENGTENINNWRGAIPAFCFT